MRFVLAFLIATVVALAIAFALLLFLWGVYRYIAQADLIFCLDFNVLSRIDAVAPAVERAQAKRELKQAIALASGPSFSTTICMLPMTKLVSAAAR